MCSEIIMQVASKIIKNKQKNTCQFYEGDLTNVIITLYLWTWLQFWWGKKNGLNRMIFLNCCKHWIIITKTTSLFNCKYELGQGCFVPSEIPRQIVCSYTGNWFFDWYGEGKPRVNWEEKLPSGDWTFYPISGELLRYRENTCKFTLFGHLTE